MKEQLVSFGTAKLAAKKGFTEIVDAHVFICMKTTKYFKKGVIEYREECSSNLTRTCNEYYDAYAAPTQSLLQKWLREKHGLDIYFFDCKNEYGMFVARGGEEAKPFSREYLSDKKCIGTYEEALEEGLKLALNLIKT